ncbi:hypothetical protein BRD01_14405 [Halobacteriales archaeon QS_8_65_32]|jgi:hypothetical protein|nr:MAG: hypothetical protein BRD01_14405 [Halobacteriales archaeon QS_8_65_32]
MRLDEYFEGVERDEAAERRRLIEDKSYAILEYLEDVERQFESAIDDDGAFGSTSPTIFVGRADYPNVSTGVLSPLGHEERAADFETGTHWYDRDFSIEDVFEHRTGLLNSTRSTDVRSVGSTGSGGSVGSGGSSRSVADAWNGILGVQREVAIADRPVDVEIGLEGNLNLDMDVSRTDVSTPTGPRAPAKNATLAENPHVPRAVKKTLSDDDWQATGAMNYLYNRGFDVYDIKTILSAGALGTTDQRRLVPTRWSITAVDDTIGNYLRGGIRNAPSVDETEVYYNDFLANQFWVIVTPGQWEFELLELKSPGSIWNPDSDSYWLASDHEGYEGRTSYVEETAGAYHAAKLGVLEHLRERGRRGRQASVLVVRHVTEDYWGPAGVWQVRETVRHALEDEPGVAEGFGEAISELSPRLPVSMADLRRKSHLVSGLQAQLSDFAKKVA